jgi:glutamate formiminotransferase
VAKAVIRAVSVAARLIDLNQHRGAHPRMGAVDAVPLIPVAGCTEPELIAFARALGERVAAETGVPVYLYGSAALRAGRESLAPIRAGEFEGLRAVVGTDPDRAPDFGPPALHPTAGATAIGDRAPQLTLRANRRAAEPLLAQAEPAGLMAAAAQLRHEAGPELTGLELVGLLPLDLLLPVVREALGLRGLDRTQVIEALLLEAPSE